MIPKEIFHYYNIDFYIGQQQTVRTAEMIISASLPSLQELYTSRVRKGAKKITLDPSHPAYSLFELLPSGRHYRALSTRTATHKNSPPPGHIDPMTAVVQRVKGFAYYSLSFSRHNKNIKMEHFLLYILSRYFI